MKINNPIFFLVAILILAIFLRFYKLNSNPPSLYWEEVALGYDAYSLLKTGKDHRGNTWPLVYIESYMDYKPPLYVYTVIPSVAMFGLNEFAVRLPSALAGTLTVLMIYFLTKELFKNFNPKSINQPHYSLLITNYLPIIASLLLAISPWHLQFSRAAFEANLALFLITAGLLCFFWSFRKQIFLLFSILFFSLSLYTYHAARVFVPLISIMLVFLFIKQLWKSKRVLLVSILLSLLLTLPLLKTIQSKEVGQRFQETSAFTDLDPIIKSNNDIAKDGGGRIAKIIHHRYFEYTQIFLTNYFKHLDGNYLFLSGDSNPRHSTGEFGQLYHWEIITLIIGLIILLKTKTRKAYFVIIWFLMSIVAGAITKANPHSIRTIFGLPALIIISSLGFIKLINCLKNYKFLVFSSWFLVLIELIIYLHFYFFHYPKMYSSYWQYGYKEAIDYFNKNKNNYTNFYLTNSQGRAYMYYLFYSKMDPQIAQELILPYKNIPDISKIGNVFIGKPPDNTGKTLWITDASEKGNGKFIKSINNLDNKKIFEIWETE